MRNFIFCLRNPRRFRIFTIELLPMRPSKPVRYEEKIRVEIDVIHDRSKQRLQAHNLGCVHVERISRKYFVNEKRNNITNVKRSLKRMRAVKRRTPDINVCGIKREMRFNIAVHSITSFFGSTAGFSSWDWSNSRSGLIPSLSRKSGLSMPAINSAKLWLNFARISTGRELKKL